MGSVICTGALEMSNSGSRIQLLIYSPLSFFKSTMPGTHLCLIVCTSFQVTSPKSVNILFPGNTVSLSLNYHFFGGEGCDCDLRVRHNWATELNWTDAGCVASWILISFIHLYTCLFLQCHLSSQSPKIRRRTPQFLPTLVGSCSPPTLFLN